MSAVRVAYRVARALGVEVGSPLEGGGSHFGQVRRAAWRTLTRHLRDPRAAVTPVSAWDSPGAYAIPSGTGLGGSSGAKVCPGRGPGGGGQAGNRPACGAPYENIHPAGLVGYGPGLDQLSFDRAHVATP